MKELWGFFYELGVRLLLSGVTCNGCFSVNLSLVTRRLSWKYLSMYIEGKCHIINHGSEARLCNVPRKKRFC